MFISRVRVENEGFLGGLDLEFKPGLNVIIGARGTGKTSIIELIRFCLDAGGFTEDAVVRGRQQAMAVLEGGAVTVDLTNPDSGETVSVTRTSSGQLVGLAPPTLRATVLAQNEVEAVGAQAAGRLHLIDRFRPGKTNEALQLSQIRSQLRSTSDELAEVIREGRNVRAQIADHQSLSTELLSAREAQVSLLSNARASDEDREKLSQYQAATSRLAARHALVEQAGEDLGLLFERLSAVAGLARTLAGGLDADHELPPLVTAVSAAHDATQLIEQARRRVETAVTELANDREVVSDERSKLESASTDLRQRLNALQQGIGAAARRIAELEERRGQLTVLTSRLEDRRTRYLDLAATRDAKYEELEAARDSIFTSRRDVASELSRRLAPTVRVRMERSANTDDYRSAIIRALRGSGVHYNTLAPAMSSKISPQELATWVETDDQESLANALGLSRERAGNLIAVLSESGMADIVGSTIDDGVRLELLDGTEYKPSDRLSIGQRCTIVLPILLGAEGDPLLIDQPEDHLDNAFIADTLVSALRQRNIGDQYIFTSHNANIPVLGEADHVVVMDSDGRRGFVVIAAPLSDPSIVRSVTSIMEGGAEAFALRSQFYAQSNRSK